MIQIRQRQWDQLAEHFKERFVERLMHYMHDAYGPLVETLEEGELRHQVRDAVHDAERFGLTLQNMMATYVVATFLVGQSFASDPVITMAMKEGHGSPDQRFAELRWRLTEEDWQHVRDRQQIIVNSPE